MNIGSYNLMYYYTANNFKQGKNNFVKRFVNDTSREVFNFVDLITGKTKLQCQYELAKLNTQYDLLQRNLNSSLSHSPQILDILR
ncbi:MAG: hypothetical protein AB1782_16065 [Cyanobacteriota bacterium]